MRGARPAGRPIARARATAGLVVAMVGVTLLDASSSALGEPLAAVGSIAAALGALCFVVRVLRSDLSAG